MKPRIVLLVAIAASIIIGCVTKNPNYTPGNTNGQPAYVVDPRIEDARVKAHQVAQPFDTVNPYAGLTHYGIDAVLGIIALVSGALVKRKNEQVGTLAAGVVRAGPEATQTVLNHAADSPHFPAIAAAINDNTVAGFAPGSIPTKS